MYLRINTKGCLFASLRELTRNTTIQKLSIIPLNGRITPNAIPPPIRCDLHVGNSAFMREGSAEQNLSGTVGSLDFESELCDLMELCMSPLNKWDDTKKGMYQYITDEIRNAASQVGNCISSGGNKRINGCADGRLDSAMKEGPFLEEMRDKLLLTNPTWDIQISPPRASCDIIINGLQINLKMTDCKTSDNSSNKRAIYYSITGQTDYPYSSTWNDFLAKLAEAKAANKIKTVRDPMTEYHYLVKNKTTGEVLFKSIFDIHTYISNPSNDLQINWRNEFANKAYHTSDEQYLNKVASLLECLQKSVRDMICRNSAFAQINIRELL